MPTSNDPSGATASRAGQPVQDFGGTNSPAIAASSPPADGGEDPVMQSLSAPAELFHTLPWHAQSCHGRETESAVARPPMLGPLIRHRYGFLNSRKVRIHLPSARSLSDLRLPTPGASKNSSTY